MNESEKAAKALREFESRLSFGLTEREKTIFEVGYISGGIDSCQDGIDAIGSISSAISAIQGATEDLREFNEAEGGK